MKKHKWAIFLIVLLVLALLGYFVTFTVGFSEIAIVKRFGQAQAPIFGSTSAGLYFKLPPPIETLVRYDGRTFIFDDTFDQVQTEDKQNVLVTVFCAWRIRDPDVFLRSIQSAKPAKEAERRLREAVRSVKQDVVGTHPLGDFLNTDPDKMKLPDIENEMKSGVQSRVEQAYGVQVVALGIKSFGLPQKVTEAVIKSMISERNRYAADFRSRGESDAALIVSQAERDRDQISQFADALASDIRTEGELAAAEYFKVYEKHKELAMLLLELEVLRDSLKGSVIVMTPESHRAAGIFKGGPGLELFTGQATTRPAAEPKDQAKRSQP
ncbi:MAG: hypothetical protein AMJ81_04565 [Phycisphaerae bacterium SM23_33]|nr:MAG: hypothetical protein AMJ81_04565 [Phycisphaerae bacterium SM23_33]